MSVDKAHERNGDVRIDNCFLFPGRDDVLKTLGDI